MKQLIDVYETRVLRVPTIHTLQPDPAPPAAQSGWKTSRIAALAIGPIDLLAGDILSVHLHHEFDSEAPGASAYVVGGQQSEHWYRWTMASTAVRVGPVINSENAGWALPAQETNWDWLIHHLGISRSGYYKVSADAPQQYVYDRVYFKSGMSYTDPNYLDVKINGGQYPLLQVGHYR